MSHDLHFSAYGTKRYLLARHNYDSSNEKRKERSREATLYRGM